ncbi:MAG: carboxymuconolactone decarboxylase family protein [Dehalococcoidia bacterium]|nr:carboxymuconolactone decarboxylase family protein [Dehalococcoidia bacterium]
MKQHIRMAAILEREGRLFLVRPRPDAPWELPGGPLPEHADDVDREMDDILGQLGVCAPAIEEDFLQTHFFPADEGQVVFNLYAATEWTGDPVVPAGHGAGWFAFDEIEAIEMDELIRNALLEALGIRTPVDRTAEILSALGGELGAPERPVAAAPTGERHHPPGREAGLDVLRTLTGADPERVAAMVARQQPELANDQIDFVLGQVWANAALDRRTRSLLVVAMLAATGRTGSSLRSHINGALNHGATPDQVVETLRMVAAYAGFPAAIEAWPSMEDVFEQRGVPRPGRAE